MAVPNLRTAIVAHGLPELQLRAVVQQGIAVLFAVVIGFG
jgi:hypothetical protein